jgi:large subunit ribosomal protein L24
LGVEMQGTHIKKGDTVKVIAGREKDKTGKVLKVIRDKNRVVIEKLNLRKKHQRREGQGWNR